MNEKLIKLHLKIVQNHQQLTALRSIISKKPDRYNELKMEMLMDVISDVVTDLSAFLIVSRLETDDDKNI